METKANNDLDWLSVHTDKTGQGQVDEEVASATCVGSGTFHSFETLAITTPQTGHTCSTSFSAGIKYGNKQQPGKHLKYEYRQTIGTLKGYAILELNIRIWFIVCRIPKVAID